MCSPIYLIKKMISHPHFKKKILLENLPLKEWLGGTQDFIFFTCAPGDFVVKEVWKTLLEYTVYFLISFLNCLSHIPLPLLIAHIMLVHQAKCLGPPF